MAVCSAVTSNDCQAPANLEPGDQPARLPRCYRCGLAVCSACSRIDRDPYVGRRTRRCDVCREADAQEALTLVMARMARRRAERSALARAVRYASTQGNALTERDREMIMLGIRAFAFPELFD